MGCRGWGTLWGWPLSLFITFEGGEGSGKSTQARALYRRLSKAGVPALLTHEPRGTALGRRVRRWLKEPGNTEISPVAELLLFAASRAQLVTESICPALEKGMIVISDRYAESTLAYQGYGRGLAVETIHAINAIACQGILPDLVILLDIPPEAGLARKKPSQDRFEGETMAFHQRVRQGYLQMAAAQPQRWLKVDGRLPRTEIEQIVWGKVPQLLAEKVM